MNPQMDTAGAEYQEDLESPLRPLCSLWNNKLKLARDEKQKKFQDFANDAMDFYDGFYDWPLYRLGDKGRGNHKGAFTFSPKDGTDALPRPTFAMTVNKVAELVQIFGPALYHRNPVRQVNPRKVPQIPPEAFGITPDMQQMMMDPTVQQAMMDPNAIMDPMMQQVMQAQQMMQQYQQYQQQIMQQQAVDQARASLLEFYLNYTPVALNLKEEFRWAIDEALIKGMGVMFTETYKPPGAQHTMVGSFFDTVDKLLIDPDAEMLRDAKWIARQVIAPYWQVEEERGLPPGTLRKKASMESFAQQSAVSSDQEGNYYRARGLSNDLIVYWKVYSKMGMGSKLTWGGMGLTGSPDDMKAFDVFGPYVYLEICEACEYPLNLPPQAMLGTGEEVAKRLQWPTPFWADDSWPCTLIYFHSIPREVWPQSHIKPAMGELKFLNWAQSFLAGKVKTASRDFLAVMKSSCEEIKKQISKGGDFTLLEVEHFQGTIDNVVQFLQHPPFNQELYRVPEVINASFEKRTGLTELAYGLSANQMRSAEEASIKGDQVSVRPDDMANKVEDAASEMARKEAFAARWHLTGDDIAPVLGPSGKQLWEQFVMPSDPREILHGLEYRIESGSARKPNRSRDAANMQQAMQSLFAPLFQYAMTTGNVAPINALIAAWAKSIDLEADQFMLSAPPPMPVPEEQPAGEAPPEGGQAA